jgi:hypothetical protein
MTNWVRTYCLAAASAATLEPMCGFAGSLDHLTDLTGRMQAIVTLKSRDNFASEYRYDVSVRNLSPDAIIGDSLIIVLDKITNLAGDDREGLTGESFLKRFDVLDPDGQTDDGKPYFAFLPGLPRTSSRKPIVFPSRSESEIGIMWPSSPPPSKCWDRSGRLRRQSARNRRYLPHLLPVDSPPPPIAMRSIS